MSASNRLHSTSIEWIDILDWRSANQEYLLPPYEYVVSHRETLVWDKSRNLGATSCTQQKNRNNQRTRDKKKLMFYRRDRIGDGRRLLSGTTMATGVPAQLWLNHSWPLFPALDNLVRISYLILQIPAGRFNSFVCICISLFTYFFYQEFFYSFICLSFSLFRTLHSRMMTVIAKRKSIADTYIRESCFVIFPFTYSAGQVEGRSRDLTESLQNSLSASRFKKKRGKEYLDKVEQLLSHGTKMKEGEGSDRCCALLGRVITG